MRILVVDDEPVHLEMLCRGLALYGHQCVAASDGVEALEILGQPAAGGVNLVLTDLTMPRMPGLELVREIERSWPDLKVIVLTGLSVSGELLELAQRGVPVLRKPFGPEELQALIAAATAA